MPELTVAEIQNVVRANAELGRDGEPVQARHSERTDDLIREAPARLDVLALASMTSILPGLLGARSCGFRCTSVPGRLSGTVAAGWSTPSRRVS
jgi:hypothetical protein